MQPPATRAGCAWNAKAMGPKEKTVKHYVTNILQKLQLRNRVEAAIRCYDPCLSCSTHAIGQMPLHLQLLAPDGTVLDELTR